MPPIATYTGDMQLIADGLFLLRPNAGVELIWDNERSEIALMHYDSAEPVPTQAEVDAAAATVPIVRETEQQAATQLRQQVLDMAKTAAGARADILTLPEMRALFAVFLREKDALDTDGKVRPPEEWVR